MNERHARLATVRRIIANGAIRSQEELRAELGKAGFEVTQATLSRDLKYLQVGKAPAGNGGSAYSLPESETIGEDDYIDDLLRGWLSIDFSGNIGVVRTWPGHADSVAIALDNLALPELLGTVAGDDTIIVVLREAKTRRELMQRLADRAPHIIPGESGDRNEE